MRTSLALLLSVFVVACDYAALNGGDGSTLEVPDCDSFSSSFVTLDSMQQPAQVFSVGETITLESRITNDGSKTQTLQGGMCPWSTIEIRDGSGQVVWELEDTYHYATDSDHAVIVIIDCVPSFPFEPGDAHAYTVDWDQRRGDDATQVAPGQYTATLTDSTECSSALNKTIAFEVQ